jgi:hypothetical protein
MIGNGNISKEYDKIYKACPKCKGIFDKLRLHTDIKLDEKNSIKFYCPKCRDEKNIEVELIDDENIKSSTPCLRMLDFRIIDGYLTTHVVYRSWSLYTGWPTNMGGFVLLNEFIASQLEGVQPGPLSFSCKSLHCYDFELEIVRQRLNK